MMKKTNARIPRKCLCCGKTFHVDPRVGDKHRYCNKPGCRHESHRISHERWLKRPENKKHYCESANVIRTQQWREANPGWRNRQQLAPQLRRIVTPALAHALISCGLKNLSAAQTAFLLGLVSNLTAARLQDLIAEQLRRLKLQGYAVLHSTDSNNSQQNP